MSRPSIGLSILAARARVLAPVAALALVVLHLATTPVALAGDVPAWPQFRGPESNGAVADDPALPETWSRTENVKWSVEIPGLGWSSPVVWGDAVFVTSCIQPGERPEPKKGLYFGGEQKEPPAIPLKWVVRRHDLATGALVWEKVAHEGVPAWTTHIKNTYASETPVTDGERVYAYFGNVGVFAFDMAGEPVWSRAFEPAKLRYGWGTAASPVLHDGRLYIVNDNDTSSFLLALEARTGEEIWRVARDEKSNWATPYVWEHDARTEIVTPGTGAIRSYDLDGKELWTLKGMSTIAIPTPFQGHGLLYVASGYVGDKLRPFYAIRPGASGDISLAEGAKSNEFVAWSDPEAGPYNPSPLLYRDEIYVLYDRGLFDAFDARTGRRLYEKTQRIERMSGGFTSSPWAYNGKVFCLSEDGVTYVIKAGPTYELLGKNDLGEMCMATPAIVGSDLLIRTQGSLFLIGRRNGN